MMFNKLKVVMVFYNKCIGCVFFELVLFENIVLFKFMSVNWICIVLKGICLGLKMIYKFFVLILNFGNEYKFICCFYKV